MVEIKRKENNDVEKSRNLKISKIDLKIYRRSYIDKKIKGFKELRFKTEKIWKRENLQIDWRFKDVEM